MGLGLEYIKTTILSGASLSSEVDLRFHRLVGVILPAAWTAADLTFQGAPEVGGVSGTFGEIVLDPGSGVGVALALDAAASQLTYLTAGGPAVGNCFMKVRSGPSGAPVNQGADRVITLVVQRTT